MKHFSAKWTLLCTEMVFRLYKLLLSFFSFSLPLEPTQAWKYFKMSTFSIIFLLTFLSLPFFERKLFFTKRSFRFLFRSQCASIRGRFLSLKQFCATKLSYAMLLFLYFRSSENYFCSHDWLGHSIFVFYVTTLAWRFQCVCIWRAKDVRSLSNNFSSTTEFHFLQWQRYKSTKFMRACSGVSDYQRIGYSERKHIVCCAAATYPCDCMRSQY